ncbi:hypothetical protein LJC16_04060, partial [Bacteroidales bacterium OttesenSCG-928-C19]|nr:hypothetical protein [Bacteroidales bacterium OttesenSCG-928-C19]
GLQGDGSKNNPVSIQSATDLKLVSDYVNSGKNSTNKYFQIDSDIDFANEALEYDLNGDGEKESNFRPIGDQLTTTFNGSFDGGNYTISGLKIKSAEKLIGLFGAAVGDSPDAKTEIKGITITDSYIECLSAETYVGSITGYAQYCNLKNCSVSAEIVSKAESAIVGGIIAYNYQNIIEDCSFKGSITSTGQGTTLGGLLAAGGQNGTLNRCYADINLSSSGDKCYIGGFAGSTHSPINNSYSVGTISVSGEQCVVGGFIGGVTSGGNISNSYAACNITSDDSEDIGGFVGKLLTSVSIKNSYFIDSWSNKTFEDNSAGVAKSELEMKKDEFVSTLNNNQTPVAWSMDVNNKNNGFPILIPKDPSVGITCPKEDNDITISYKESNIEITGKQLEYVQIVDMQGRIIQRENISGNFFQLGFSQSMGIYIIIVKSASHTKIDKLFLF